MADPFNGKVVQVDVSDRGKIPDRLRIDGKAMILRGDFHPAGLFVQDGLICPAMAEFQLENLRPARQSPSADRGTARPPRS